MPKSLSMVEGARSYLEAWSTVQQINRSPKLQPSQIKWTKPPHGWTKLNVNAPINKELKTIGLGFILRNDNGGFVAAKEKMWQGLYNAKEAEALAVREALSWIKELNIDHVQVETDALLVIQGLQKNSCISSFDLILEDIHKLASHFRCISFMFAKRSANSTAHLLAREAVFKVDCIVWATTPPLYEHPIAHNILASETVQSPALPLEGVDDVHRRHGLPPSVLSVGHGVSDHILEEDFEDSPGLLVDEAGDTLHASSTSQTANGRLGDPLDVVAKHLPVTLGSSLAQSLASFSTAGHFCRVKKEI
nr:uncharacterized protein LOC109155154 [Ipomoea batatas]